VQTETSNIIHLLTDSQLTCFVVPQLFSKEECEALLDDEVKASFQKVNTHYPTYYRNNDRLVIDSHALSRLLFDKVREHLPQRLDGGLSLHGINERFRYCRYAPGQRFSRHLDGIHHRSEKVHSRLTFLLYLNSADRLEGGRTLFYKARTGSEVWAAWMPSQGDLVIFDHNIWHEGEELVAGEKFILRSDILYELDPTATESELAYEAHMGYVWKMLELNDRVLSAGRDTTIRVWGKNEACEQVLRGHRSSVLCMERMNDACFISGSRDQTIKVWEMTEGKFVHTRDIDEHKTVMLALCRLDNETFAAGSADNVIRIFSLEGNLYRTLTGHTDWVWSIVKISGDMIASSSEDGTVRIWDHRTGECVQVIEDGCPVHALAWDEEAGALVSGNYKGELRTRRTGDWKKVQEIAAHDGIIRAILIIDRERMASGGEDSMIKVWNRASGECVAVHAHSNFVQTLVKCSDKIISGSYDGEIKSWKL
jgi:WD40 repeat protein